MTGDADIFLHDLDSTWHNFLSHWSKHYPRHIQCHLCQPGTGNWDSYKCGPFNLHSSFGINGNICVSESYFWSCECLSGAPLNLLGIQTLRKLILYIFSKVICMCNFSLIKNFNLPWVNLGVKLKSYYVMANSDYCLANAINHIVYQGRTIPMTNLRLAVIVIGNWEDSVFHYSKTLVI